MRFIEQLQRSAPQRGIQGAEAAISPVGCSHPPPYGPDALLPALNNTAAP